MGHFCCFISILGHNSTSNLVMASIFLNKSKFSIINSNCEREDEKDENKSISLTLEDFLEFLAGVSRQHLIWEVADLYTSLEFSRQSRIILRK